METTSIIIPALNTPNNGKNQIWKWDPVSQTLINLAQNSILEIENSTGQIYTKLLGNGNVVDDSKKWSPFNKSSTFLINKASKSYLDLDASCNLRSSTTPTAFSYWTFANGMALLC